MKVYGLIGKQLGHSFSQRFFEEKFEREGIKARYINLEIPSIQDFQQVLIQHPNLAGLNVTIPYKSEIIPFLDGIDAEAKQIGAVNTIVFRGNQLIGYNTDAFGFHQSIKPFLRNIHERALILGTGGASKAVAHVLRNLGIDLAFLSRTPKGHHEYDYSVANEYMFKAFKLIVNTTPLGTFPKMEECPPIPLEYFTPDHLVIDLIYNPEKTLLLQAAEQGGANILNGRSMLEHQALKAWEIWNTTNQ